MIYGAKQRALEKLAFRYHLKDKKRTQTQNWKLAEQFLLKLIKRIEKYAKDKEGLGFHEPR